MIRKILAAALALSLVFGAAGLTNTGIFNEQAVITASAETYGDYEYEILDDGTVDITGYTGEDTELIVPSEFDGVKVTSIRRYAFEGYDNLKSVIIPDSVTEIGSYAFLDCENITDIIIPNGVTSIGSGTFSHCSSLTSITIPDNVAGIGDFAFTYCTSLKSVIIPSSVSAIGTMAFSHCTNLESIIIPESVTGIYDSFSGCDNLVIYCYEGSAAEQYAIDNDINYVLIKDITLTDEYTNISVSATTDVISEETILNVAQNAATDTQVSYDITLTDAEGNAVQPDGDVTVTIPVPSDWENAYVYRAEEDGTYTDMNAVYADGYATFVTDHFSTYILSEAELDSDATVPDDTDDGNTTTDDTDTPDDTTPDDSTSDDAANNDANMADGDDGAEGNDSSDVTANDGSTSTVDKNDADANNGIDKNVPTGATAGLALAGLALAGVAIVATKKNK